MTKSRGWQRAAGIARQLAEAAQTSVAAEAQAWGIGQPRRVAASLVVVAFFALFFPVASTLLLAVASAVTTYVVVEWTGTRARKGRGKSRAKGIFFLGIDRDNGGEVWLTEEECKQHFLVLGTEGSGKTEFLLSSCANALSWSSGAIFVDGRGDVAVLEKIHALARRFGREDDLLVLDFVTNESWAPGGIVPTNTMNPFSTGSSDSLTQMVVSLMDEPSNDGAMWKGRATAMMNCILRALTSMRDQGLVDLNVGTIRDHLNLRRIIDLADEELWPNLSPAIRKDIGSYLASLPGYQPEKGHRQAQTTLDQHGYLEMQFTRIMGSLADVYGHVFTTPYGEVDMHDVVANRRILVVMLPFVGMATDEVANLGKIVVASLKQTIGSTLSNPFEATHAGTTETRLANPASPFVAAMDEVGYYCVNGMDLMAAQARSLGISMIYTAQGIDGMKRLNDGVVGSIIGNTNTKVIMRIEDTKTAEMAIKLANKAYKPTIGGHVVETSTSFMDGEGHIKFLDLKSQSEGQMHAVYKDQVIRAQALYCDPAGYRPRSKAKVNSFVALPPPNMETEATTTKERAI